MGKQLLLKATEEVFPADVLLRGHGGQAEPLDVTQAVEQEGQLKLPKTR